MATEHAFSGKLSICCKNVPTLSCPAAPEKACLGLGKPWEPSMLFQENGLFFEEKNLPSLVFRVSPEKAFCMSKAIITLNLPVLVLVIFLSVSI